MYIFLGCPQIIYLDLTYIHSYFPIFFFRKRKISMNNSLDGRKAKRIVLLNNASVSKNNAAASPPDIRKPVTLPSISLSLRPISSMISPKKRKLRLPSGQRNLKTGSSLMDLFRNDHMGSSVQSTKLNIPNLGRIYIIFSCLSKLQKIIKNNFKKWNKY